MPVISNWGTAIVSSLANALNLILAFVPRLIGFLLILLVGWIIATLISKGVTLLLRKIGFDRLGDRIGLTRFEQNMRVKLDAAGILGKVVYWFIFLIFLVSASDALGVPAVTNVLNSIVTFLPNVFVAIVVLFLGALLATFAADLTRGATASAHVGNPNVFANIARYAIIGFAILIALEQIHIAPALLNELFGAIVAAAALAFGLAFGLGGRETAQRLLNRSEGTMSAAAQQSTQQQQQPSGAINTRQAQTDPTRIQPQQQGPYNRL